jgi:uncharacterized protein YndB with AHSA1/START domain
MKTKGLSKDSGWEVGVRRTFAVPASKTWDLIFSKEGLRIWLGDVPNFTPAKGEGYKLVDGTHGEVITFTPGSHLRLTWQPRDYPRPSIIQVRVKPNGDKTTIAFHQEQLPDAAARAERGEYFMQALDGLGELISKEI